jgi:CRP-like cAMP-binding protein
MDSILREHIEKIVPLTDDEFAFVRSHFTQKKYKKHQFLIQEGEPVPYSYFVISGLLKLVHTDDSGKEHIVSFAMEDWWESDFQAFHNGAKATMSLDCLEDTEVFCLTLDSYRKLCVGLQKMEHFFLEKANRGHIGSQQRILSLKPVMPKSVMNNS